MTNAQSFWGVAHATPATCVTTASTTTLTCNGDGNGSISQAAVSANESYRFWQHLANAGLIEGSFSGITQGSTATSSTTANSPKGKLGTTLWFVLDWGTQLSGTTQFDGVYGNSFEFGGSAANSDPAVPVLKNEEIWNLDTKLDDGKPATGKLVVRGSLAGCTDTATTSNMAASYLLNSATAACAIMFTRAF